MADQKVMKDGLGFNDPVAITLPAHVWHAFMAQYATTEWSSNAAAQICIKVQEELLDPIYVREREAEAQAHHDQHEMVLQRFMGLPPDLPPNMGDPG